MEKIDNIIELEYIKEDDDIELYKLLEILEHIEEGYDTDTEIEIDDLDTYNIVTLNYKENIKLENIVIDEVNKLYTSDIESYRELKNKVIDLVRKNSMYAHLSNKNKLSCCVTSVLNKNNILYTFNLQCKIFEIFIRSCEKKFEEVYDLLRELKEDIEETIDKYTYHSEECFIKYQEEYLTKYKDKLEDIRNTVDDMIEFEKYIEDTSLKYDLLEYIDLRTSKEINSKYKNLQSIRKYKSKVRVSKKEETRMKAIELKNNGLGNNQIARALGKSKGYISDLLRNKK